MRESLSSRNMLWRHDADRRTEIYHISTGLGWNIIYVMGAQPMCFFYLYIPSMNKEDNKIYIVHHFLTHIQDCDECCSKKLTQRVDLIYLLMWIHSPYNCAKIFCIGSKSLCSRECITRNMHTFFFLNKVTCKYDFLKSFCKIAC